MMTAVIAIVAIIIIHVMLKIMKTTMMVPAGSNELAITVWNGMGVANSITPLLNNL